MLPLMYGPTLRVLSPSPTGSSLPGLNTKRGGAGRRRFARARREAESEADLKPSLGPYLGGSDCYLIEILLPAPPRAPDLACLSGGVPCVCLQSGQLKTKAYFIF